MSAARAVVERFNDAFNAHDLDGVMAMMTDDCVFEGTGAPDGHRSAGQRDVRRTFADFFAGSPDASFTAEEVIAADDRVVVRWRYRWSERDGPAGHVRGVDLFRIRDGLVSEKLSYVKG